MTKVQALPVEQVKAVCPDFAVMADEITDWPFVVKFVATLEGTGSAIFHSPRQVVNGVCHDANWAFFKQDDRGFLQQEKCAGTLAGLLEIIDARDVVVLDLQEWDPEDDQQLVFDFVNEQAPLEEAGEDFDKDNY